MLIALGPCWACERLFVFNPELVPVVLIDRASNTPPDLLPAGTPVGEVVRAQLCRPCVDLNNAERERRGLPLIDVLPGAYPDEEE